MVEQEVPGRDLAGLVVPLAGGWLLPGPVGALPAGRHGRESRRCRWGVFRSPSGGGEGGAGPPLVWNGPAALVPVRVGVGGGLGSGDPVRGPGFLPVAAAGRKARRIRLRALRASGHRRPSGGQICGRQHPALECAGRAGRPAGRAGPAASRGQRSRRRGHGQHENRGTEWQVPPVHQANRSCRRAGARCPAASTADGTQVHHGFLLRSCRIHPNADSATPKMSATTCADGFTDCRTGVLIHREPDMGRGEPACRGHAWPIGGTRGIRRQVRCGGSRCP